MGLFANYDIEDIISSDNVSTLYRCAQTAGSKPLAIEVLSQQLVDVHPEITQHFERDKLPQLRLNQSHIARIVDSGVSAGLPYFVSEFQGGITLDRFIADSSHTLDEKLGIIVQLCKVLNYAHRNGIMHLRLSPANIFVTPDNHIIVRGFGLAQFLEKVVTDKNAIRAKLMLGSMTYTPPEMRTPDPLTAAADIYSLGVIMYELVTGGRPVDITRTPKDINPSCPIYLDQLIMHCLEKDPASRPATASQILMKLLAGLQDAHIDPAKKQAAMAGIDDEFVLLDILKESSQSIVYLFRNTVNDRLIVVKKILNPEKDLLQCKALSGLRHANIVNIFGASSVDGNFLLKMEYMDRGSLKDRMAMVWPWREALKVARDVCAGLAFAHRADIIHGNLRPSNVFLSESGSAKIADFCLDEHYHGTANANWYRLAKEENTRQADIFSVGAMLFEMLTGRIYNWQKPEWAVDKHYMNLPSGVQQLISRMLETVPKDRYKNCDEIIILIDELLTPAKSAKKSKQAVKASAPKSRKMGILLILFLAVFAVLFGYYFLFR